MTNTVWVVFVPANRSTFPNFFPVGIYTSKENALNEISKLPNQYEYQLFEMPLDKFFGHINNSEIESNLGSLYHEHFESDILPMARIRDISQKAIKEKGLTEEEIRRSLGMKRYEK